MLQSLRSFLLLCWVVVPFGICKSPTMYWMYHNWIHSFHHSPVSSLYHHSWNSLNRYHFCICIRISDLILRSLIHFELILLWGERHASSFSFLHVDTQFSQKHLWKRLSFLCRMFLVTLSKSKWVYLCGFISGSSVLFHLSSCLFLCQYHAIFIAMTL
jgi:hypothetical protein